MLENHKGVFVYAEQRDGVLQSVALELIGKAKELAAKLNTEVTAVAIGKNIKSAADVLAHHGADNVIIIEDDRVGTYINEPYVKALYEVIEDKKPEIVLFGATTIGRDLAPRVSARVHTGLTADCTSLDIEEGTNLLLMTRPAFGGNIMATIICQDYRPQITTVRPGVMQKLEENTSLVANVEEFKVVFEDSDFNVNILSENVSEKKLVKIEEASVLVSVGRGFGAKEKLVEAEALADVMDATLSGSRAVVDAGWIGKERQVGQTGKTVRPGLYMALGISGAIQHVAGMEESEYIIAVNKTDNAPIFELADIGIVGDVNKVVPELTKLIADYKASKE